MSTNRFYGCARECARLVVLGLMLCAASNVQAISGIEGTFEYAIDAPWRIEPYERPTDSDFVEYGEIPIQIAILDANQAGFDDEEHLERAYYNGPAYPEPLPGPLALGRFCQLSVEYARTTGSIDRRVYRFDELAEIERTRGSWSDEGPDSEPSRREVCRQDQGESCASMAEMARSSAWYGLAWYPVPADRASGSSIDLALEVKLSRTTQGGCDSSDPSDVLTLRNHVSVELARAPLPRFDNGWVYGDLHYHAQGTDNEGEAAYNYRGVARAMGAMGLDFVFATEHASASAQLVDADMHLEAGKLVGASNRSVLRDMNRQRFQTLLADLHSPSGANFEAAVRGPLGTLPQSTRVSGKAPQVFLGGEVDVIGETADAAQFIEVGNGLTYDVENLCGGHSWAIAGTCAQPVGPPPLFEEAENGFLVKDLQGPNDINHFTRLHLIYLPRRADDAEAFVPSHTSEYGGATRRLAESHRGRPPVGPEIRDHGYAFVAHPMSGLGSGSKGPDSLPWTTHMLEKAFAEPAVLGLQLWNENTRHKHALENSDHALFHVAPEPDDEYQGYERPEKIEVAGFEVVLPRDTVREGFYTGHFELDASGFLSGHAREGSPYDAHALYDAIAHGSYLWDQMNLWGLDPGRTSGFDWLPTGDPRRVFMAGGSDAHGDFNYRREGYFLGDTKVTDTAIGKPRNLVDVGLVAHASDPSAGEEIGALDPRPSNPILVGHVASTDSPATLLESGSSESNTVQTSVGGAPTTYEDGTNVLVGDHPESIAPIHLEQHVVVDALAGGRFSVTDGPALRIVVDRNRDGQIGTGDTPMGGIIDLYGEDTLPILVEWKSTEDFGAIQHLAFVIGSANGEEARLYGAFAHGARGNATPTPMTRTILDEQGSRYRSGDDHYWRIDDVPLTVPLTDANAMQGTHLIELDLTRFLASQGVEGERFFVRAVARTDASLARFAYTNPVWAVQRGVALCTAEASRGFDADGDDIPDACDPCPYPDETETQVCGVEGPGTTIFGTASNGAPAEDADQASRTSAAPESGGNASFLTLR